MLGTLINYSNMKRVNTRGLKAANKHVLMAALTYNLKKYLKFSRLEIKTRAKQISSAVREFIFSNLATLSGFHTLEMVASKFQISKPTLKTSSAHKSAMKAVFHSIFKIGGLRT